MTEKRIRICKYGPPATAADAGCYSSISNSSGTNFKAGDPREDMYSSLVRWLSKEFSWNKKNRYFWLNLDTAEEINKNTEWQSGPNDADTIDKATVFNGWQWDPNTDWGDNENYGKSSRAEWTQSRQGSKMQLLMGDGEEGNKEDKAEGVQSGVVGIHCGMNAEEDNSGAFANAGYDHVYLLYRIDASNEELEDILDQLGRAVRLLESVDKRLPNPRFNKEVWTNNRSSRKMLDWIISHIRNGVISFETQALDLKEKLTAGVLTSQDIFVWAIMMSTVAEPRSTDISIIKRIIKWIISQGDAGQSRQEMMMLAECTTKLPAETRSAFNYTWNDKNRQFVCRNISQQAIDMVFLLDLRANAILWHLDSDGSSGFFSYKRYLRFTRCSPIYAYEPDNIFGKVYDKKGEERTAYKLPAPYGAFKHKGPGQKELYFEMRDWPYEGSQSGLDF